MPGLLDYLERAVTGPILTQKDFQMKVLIPNVRKTVKEFEITYDPRPVDVPAPVWSIEVPIEGAEEADYLPPETVELVWVTSDRRGAPPYPRGSPACRPR